MKRVINNNKFYLYFYLGLLLITSCRSTNQYKFNGDLSKSYDSLIISVRYDFGFNGGIEDTITVYDSKSIASFLKLISESSNYVEYNKLPVLVDIRIYLHNSNNCSKIEMLLSVDKEATFHMYKECNSGFAGPWQYNNIVGNWFVDLFVSNNIEYFSESNLLKIKERSLKKSK